MGNVKKLKEIIRATDKARRAGKKIVSTSGCFDILHVGHVRNLAEAKKLGDILVVGINSDTSVRRYKGRTRPIINERERAEVIAALKPVDYVYIFSEDNPCSCIEKLRPHVHVKGRGAPHDLEKKAVEKGGGTFMSVRFIKGKSTTNMLRKIKGK